MTEKEVIPEEQEKWTYTWEEFDSDIRMLAHTIRPHADTGEYDFLCGIPRGGMVVAAALSHYLNDMPIIETAQAIEIERRIRARQSFIGSATDDLKRLAEEGERVLLVDDCTDQGLTLRIAPAFDVAVIHYKPWSHMRPRFYVHQTSCWLEYPWEKDSKRDYLARFGRPLTKGVQS